MTEDDLERRIRQLEQEIVGLRQTLVEHDHSLAVLATGVTIARWLGPFIVSIATVIIVLAKGG